jgi:hypothetical protein
MSRISICGGNGMFLCLAFLAAFCVSAADVKNKFGLEIVGKHVSGCLIVKSASGKAAECGIRRLDLICSVRKTNLTADGVHALTKSTPCAHFTLRRHSTPCLSMPFKNAKKDASKFHFGLNLNMSQLRHPQDPNVISNHFIVESITVGSLASQFPIFPGDWVRSIDGQLLFRKSVDDVRRLMQGSEGAGGDALEVCAWSKETRLTDLSSQDNDKAPQRARPNSLTSAYIALAVCVVTLVIIYWTSQYKSKTVPAAPNSSRGAIYQMGFDRPDVDAALMNSNQDEVVAIEWLLERHQHADAGPVGRHAVDQRADDGSIGLLRAIATEYPKFHLDSRALQKLPKPTCRPLSIGKIVKMHFNEVDYGTSFAPFLSADVLPSCRDPRPLIETVIRFTIVTRHPLCRRRCSCVLCAGNGTGAVPVLLVASRYFITRSSYCAAMVLP